MHARKSSLAHSVVVLANTFWEVVRDDRTRVRLKKHHLSYKLDYGAATYVDVIVCCLSLRALVVKMGDGREGGVQ